jgi:hypothetical protein
MRRFLSTIRKIIGLALGLCVAGILIALEWPDVTSSADNLGLGRHVLDVLWLDLAIGFAIGFPFLWLGDKLSPDDSDESAHAATSE